MKNKKQKGTLLCWISLIVLNTFLVFFVIGCNSNTLVNKIFKIISLLLLIGSVIFLAIGLFLRLKYKKRRGLNKKLRVVFDILVYEF